MMQRQQLDDEFVMELAKMCGEPSQRAVLEPILVQMDSQRTLKVAAAATAAAKAAAAAPYQDVPDNEEKRTVQKQQADDELTVQLTRMAAASQRAVFGLVFDWIDQRQTSTATGATAGAVAATMTAKEAAATTESERAHSDAVDRAMEQAFRDDTPPPRIVSTRFPPVDGRV